MNSKAPPGRRLLLIVAAFALVGLGVLAGRFIALREVPTKEHALEAFSETQADFGSLHRALNPGARRLVDDPEDSLPIPEHLDEPLTREDLRYYADSARREALALIRRELRARYQSFPAPQEERRLSHLFPSPEATWNWSQEPGEVCRSVTVENLGPGPAEKVVLVIDGRRPATTVGEMAASMIGSSATEKDKAIALWRGVSDGRCHDWPAHKEAFDPVKLLGVYGYGFCLDVAQALALLAGNVGLSARVMHARGSHVVTEIMVDGRWALFDADAAVFYTRPDGILASVADVQQDLELLSVSDSNVYSEDHLRRIYASGDFKERGIGDLPATHSLQVNLRPGESIVYSRDKRGLFFASRYLEEPKEYANGLWLFRPLLSGNSWKAQSASSENLEAVQDAGGSWSLSSIDPKKPSHLTCQFALPYPALDGEVEVGFSGEGLSLEISHDGRDWKKTAQSVAADGTKVFSLSDWLQPIGGEPNYRFRVKLAISPSGTPARITGITYRYDLQMAPRNLPFPSDRTRTVGLDYAADQPAQISVQAVLIDKTKK